MRREKWITLKGSSFQMLKCVHYTFSWNNWSGKKIARGREREKKVGERPENRDRNFREKESFFG